MKYMNSKLKGTGVVLLLCLSISLGSSSCMDTSLPPNEYAPANTQVRRYPAVRPSYQDYRVQPYMAKFHDLTDVDISMVPVLFDEGFQYLRGREAGVCTLDVNDDRVIILHPTYWQFGTTDVESSKKNLEAFRELLLFHELGHCLLYQDHRADVMDTEWGSPVPASIMYPQLGASIIYAYKREPTYYIKELINAKPDIELLSTESEP